MPTLDEPVDQGQAIDRALRALVEEVARELHPQRRMPALGLDASLERDLGIDSLGRIELLQRIERRFDVALPEREVVQAESLRQLARAVRAAARAGTRRASLAAATRDAAVEDVPPPADEAGHPEAASTLVEALRWHTERHPDRPYLLLYPDAPDQPPAPLTYGELLAGASRVAGALRARDLSPGETVALMLPTCRELFLALHGVLLAGGVPVPIYPPQRPSQLEEHLRRQMAILDNAQARHLVTVEEVLPLAPILRAHLPDLRMVVTTEEMLAEGAAPAQLSPRAEDVALLQYTSGSTGLPKGVVLSHANLLANLRAMGQAIDVRPADVFVSWLPLYHDMGLIGASLGALLWGFRLVLLSPLAFIARPARWLQTISRQRGTISASPNFGYEVCASRLSEEDVRGLDLSCWRVAFNGAEPVSADTVERFCARFAPVGFRREAMTPVYGLAECSLGLTFPPLGRGARVDRIRREPLQGWGRAEPAGADEVDALRFVSCGLPLPRHEVRIVDEAGRELGERRVGRLHFRGPSATQGYHRNPAATAGLFCGDDWRDSGDNAYVSEGEVFVTGRAKDLIIKAGRNLYPDELEQLVGDLQGARKGCVAVFGAADHRGGTERLVVLVETRLTEPSALDDLRARVEEVTREVLGVPPDEVLLAPPHTVRKTSSGKVRRSTCRELYERGELIRARAVWWQVARLWLSGLAPRMRGTWRAARARLFAGYAYGVAGIVGAIGSALALALPRLAWRRAVASACVRLAAALTRIPLEVRGLDVLPDGPCMVVANHGSYLDGIVLAAVLPRRCDLVAKGELRGNVYTRALLGRLGHRFVERQDPSRGAVEVESLSGALRAGRSLVFFPEGTFDRMPGLREFRLGAFQAAAAAGAPVVPVAIRGTRSILRGDQWYPRHGAVAVLVAPPIPCQGSGWEEALRLRDAARAEILRRCGEPDLAHEELRLPAPTS